MKREFVDFNEVKKGDIILQVGYDGSCGNLIMFDHADDGLIHWLCWFDISKNEFHVNNNPKTHFGNVNEGRRNFKMVVPTESEKILMDVILDKYGYYFDEDDNCLVQEGVPTVGQPKITWDDEENHEMVIKGLDGAQRNIIRELIKSWEHPGPCCG
jgi:hypothetical protein